ncbi:hypothetical protein BDEG_24683 [Batrachochytrium dendrobatidis JEL423]|uniref:Uncharacterized protein n=1 Tax=Batrachochytrium dendrobatidis (strain JEL423) TaxID=403673 RepID=A0A177WNL1_BATDL|nr:hypothetical protein BDEG_24683 [Batrachochytrium dendrobatidis JEL423]
MSVAKCKGKAGRMICRRVNCPEQTLHFGPTSLDHLEHEFLVNRQLEGAHHNIQSASLKSGQAITSVAAQLTWLNNRDAEMHINSHNMINVSFVPILLNNIAFSELLKVD